jgi:hypothetical protein
MSNVVGLRGCAPCVKEPNADVVAKCEELLALALAGEITGIQCVTVSADALAGLARAGGLSYSAIGMLHYAAHEAVEEMRRIDP